MKWIDTFIKRNVVKIFPVLNPLYLHELSNPQILKMHNHRYILVTQIKMQPHYSQSIHENLTPSSAISPLASYC